MKTAPRAGGGGGEGGRGGVCGGGGGKRVLRIYREEQAPVDFVCMAHGTARTEMLDLLGIGETAKAIVMCMVSRQTGVRLLKRLGRELKCDIGRGIAFAIPITGIGLRWHKLLTAADEEQKGGQPDARDREERRF